MQWEIMVWTGLGLTLPFLATVLGGAAVFLIKTTKVRSTAFIYGFTAGIMTAASIWSLLLPSIEQLGQSFHAWAFFPVCIGVLLGGAVIFFLKNVCEKLPKERETDGAGTQRNGNFRLFLAMTLHNVPEGLAVGFAFGLALSTHTQGALLSAFLLAVGIALQNVPEGAAVTLPLVAVGESKKKAFMRGVFSGLPELVFAFCGVFLAAYLRVVQPWLLAFSAGTMLFVSADDLLPSSRLDARSSLGAWGFLLGFACMMALDVALG